VALIAVNNKQPIRSSRDCLYIGVKVLKLRYRNVVISLASRRDSNNLVARETSKLGGDKDLACKDKEE
jgi:hypothetical protein